MQLDVCKIAPGLYQYTAIDDCSRFQVLGLYPRRTAANTLAFLEQVLEEMPFPVQRIQTDRGQEFFAYKVQEQLQAWRIKFRPIRPRSPHLNGKVERAQRTALEEFWATVDLDGTRPRRRSSTSGRPSTTGSARTARSAAGRRSTVSASCSPRPRSPRQVWDAYDPSREINPHPALPLGHYLLATATMTPVPTHSTDLYQACRVGLTRERVRQLGG